ncbi:MAG: phosphate ABC transporter permease subunit PstC [Bdellovibrionia bacterium]
MTDNSVPAVESISVSSVKRGKKRDVHAGDRVFFWSLRAVATALILILVAVAFQIGRLSLPALKSFGLGFVSSQVWNPVSDVFGAGSFIYGTVVSSAIAILIAFPVSVGVALFLNEIAHARIAAMLGFLVEMLAAIPSVVYGLWGIFVLAPWLRVTVQPFLIAHLGFLPIFRGPAYGVSMFTAGVVLAIMIVPTIAAICREVFRAIPLSQREAALALGATRWEAIRVAVLKSSHVGILGAVILGLGRALGETMAVTMVIGNRNEISASLFAPAQTMASVIANEYAEATSDVHLSALAAVGLILFVVSFLINSVARLLVWRVSAKRTAK